jgi:hypothetical protein
MRYERVVGTAPGGIVALRIGKKTLLWSAKDVPLLEEILAILKPKKPRARKEAQPIVDLD